MPLFSEIKTRRSPWKTRCVVGRRRDVPAEREEIAAQTLRVIAEPGFAPLFAPGSRAEVAIAGSAPELPAGVVVNGQIDRLVITETEALIVDSKTNRPPPMKAEDAPSVYIAQLAAYRALVKTLHPNRTVRCALLWTDAPRLMEIPQAMMEAALDQARGARTSA